MKFLPCQVIWVVMLIMAGCVSTSGYRQQSNRDVSDYTIAETTDLSKAFATTDAEELRIAEESMNTLDEQYADDKFPYPVSDMDAQNLLICVREIVERQLGGLDGTRKAAEFLVALDNKLTLEQSARAVLESCESYRSQASAQPINRNEQAKYISHLRTATGATPVKAKITLYRFVKPTTSCWSVGLAADVALLAGAGADGGLEYCGANNGRRWIQVALEGRAGYGAGGFALMRLGRYRYRMNYLGGPFTYTKTKERKWAVAFGMLDKQMGEDYQHHHKGVIIVLPSKKANKNALGLGIGYFKSWGMRGGFKFLPLGTNKKGMLKEFRGLSRKDLFAEEATIQHVISDSGTYILRVTPEYSSDDPKVKFTLCNRDTDVCADLFAGKYFSIKKMQENLAALQRAADHLEGEWREDSIKTALYATVALSFAGTYAVRRVLDQLTTEGDLHNKKSIWKGARAYTAPIPEKRGIKWFPFESLNEFFQKIADSKPVLAIRDISARLSESWNKMFTKGPSFVRNDIFRLGIPGVAVVAGGVMAMIHSVKEGRGEILVRTYHNISDKQNQIISAIPNPEREVLISAGTKDDFLRALSSLIVEAE